jgi:hypothetical protein
MVLKGGGRGPTKIGVVSLSDARSEQSARGMRLVALDYVWSSDKSIRVNLGCDERAHCARPSPRRGLRRKNGGNFGRCAGNAGGHVGDVCSCGTPALFPAFFESNN